MSEQQPKANFYLVAFFVDKLPAYFTADKAGQAAVQLAQEMYRLQPNDFQPKHGGRYYGQGKYGHTFEVQIKREAAEALAVNNPPSILNIFE